MREVEKEMRFYRFEYVCENVKETTAEPKKENKFKRSAKRIGKKRSKIDDGRETSGRVIVISSLPSAFSIFVVLYECIYILRFTIYTKIQRINIEI